MLKIVGDINLTDGYFDIGFGIGSKLKYGFDPFNYIHRDIKDCWIGNFEGVASEYSEKAGHYALQFRIKPDHISHLKHFNIYGLANNHVMQHGTTAYIHTWDFLTSQGAKCFGSKNLKTQLFEHQGRLVSITGFSQRVEAFSYEPCYWYNPEYYEIEQEFRLLPKNAYKIVFVHWGNEFIDRPSTPQKHFAHWLIDTGFDIVIGMHPHVLQGYEKYKDKYIFYSLGNFVFNMAWEPTQYGVIIGIDLSKELISPIIEYIKISKEFIPMPIAESLVPEKLHFDYLNQRLQKDDNTEEYHIEINNFYKKYRKANHRAILYNMIRYPSTINKLINDYVKRRFIK